MTNPMLDMCRDEGHSQGVPASPEPRTEWPEVETWAEIRAAHRQQLTAAVLHLRNMGLSKTEAAQCLCISRSNLTNYIYRHNVPWPATPTYRQPSALQEISGVAR